MDKIICVGKNYPDHAQELGEAQPAEPVLFLKPPSALMQLSMDPTPTEISLPPGEVNFEIEIVFSLESVTADNPFIGFTLGLDLTRRDLQTQLKKNGHPWEIAKVFRHSAVVGPWFLWRRWREFYEKPFELWVNDRKRQCSDATRMLFSPERCLALAKRYFPLCQGDILFTGTPTGVGVLQVGDRLEMRWGEELISSLKVVEQT
jgi:fumarylpyruvate hydrolase